MKGLSRIVAALAGVALVVAGCAPPAAPAPTPAAAVKGAGEAAKPGPSGGVAKQLTLVTWDFQPTLVQSFVSRFEQQNAGYKINVVVYPTVEYSTKVKLMASARQDFDVLYVKDEELAEWSAFLQPIDELPGAAELSQAMIPVARKSLTYKGKLYGLPYYSGFFAFTYNEKMLKEAGLAAPPKTWDEMIQQARAIQQKGLSKHPLVYPGQAGVLMLSWVYYSMLAANGGKLFGPAYAPTAEAKKTLQQLVDAHKAGISTPAVLQLGYIEAVKAFMTGEHAFMIGNSLYSGLQYANHPEQSRVAGAAKLAPMLGSGATVGWARGYGMSVNAKDKQAAWKLQSWLGGKDATGAFHTAKGWIERTALPYGYAALKDDPDVKKQLGAWTDVDLWNGQLNRAVAVSEVAPFDEVWFARWDDFLKQTLQKALLGQLTVDEALRQVSDRAKELAGSR